MNTRNIILGKYCGTAKLLKAYDDLSVEMYERISSLEILKDVPMEIFNSIPVMIYDNILSKIRRNVQTGNPLKRDLTDILLEIHNNLLMKIGISLRSKMTERPVKKIHNSISIRIYNDISSEGSGLLFREMCEDVSIKIYKDIALKIDKDTPKNLCNVLDKIILKSRPAIEYNKLSMDIFRNISILVFKCISENMVNNALIRND